MATVRKFLHEQRNAALAVMMSIDGLRDTEVTVTAELQREDAPPAAPEAGSVGEIRARIADLEGAVAELSEVWSAHRDLWEGLDPEDAAVMAEARGSWRDLQDAARRAASLRDSLDGLARAAEGRSDATPSALRALDGLRAALAELDALAGRYRATLAEVEPRLGP